MPNAYKCNTETTTEKGNKAAGGKRRKSAARVTKRDQLVRMLSTKTGVAIPAISKKMGWQPHTTRAALSGLRKAGHEVIRTPASNGGAARYRIGPAPKPARAGAGAPLVPADAG